MNDKEEIERLKLRLYEAEQQIIKLKNQVEPNWMDDDEYDDMGYDEDDEEERQYQEDAERASNCKCGAWTFGKDGNVYHVADCYCGAD